MLVCLCLSYLDSTLHKDASNLPGFRLLAFHHVLLVELSALELRVLPFANSDERSQAECLSPTWPAQPPQSSPAISHGSAGLHRLRLTATLCLPAGYQRLDYALGVLLKDTNVVTVGYAHNVDATLAAGAEMTKHLNEKEGTSFTLG